MAMATVIICVRQLYSRGKLQVFGLGFCAHYIGGFVVLNPFVRTQLDNAPIDSYALCALAMLPCWPCQRSPE